jgi:ATP-binding cassette subfamily B protein RaxB
MIGDFIDFRGHRRLPSILQTEASECGLACLAMAASYFGHKVDLNTLRRRYPVSMNGVTLRGLIQIAHHMHLACRPIRFELDDLHELTVPAIVHWDMNHFVVLRSVSRKGIVVHDPAAGVRTYTLEQASQHLTGVALELSRAEGFEQKEERAKLPFRAFWANLPGLSSPLTQIFVLAIILELLVVAAPFYLQLAVDEVVARGDRDLMLDLALGFGLLMAIQVITEALRARIMLMVQSALHFTMAARLFHHLLRLPLSFFEKRHIGDILSRFSSITPLRSAVAEGLVLSVIDGIMAVATLAMIVIYSVKLAAVTLAALCVYLVLRLSLFRYFRDLNETVIQTEARENSNFIESVRAIQTIKLFNRESDREGQWLNRHADTVNASIGVSRAGIQFKAINQAIFGLEQIVTVYIAAMLAADNVITVGMVFAFMSYKTNFIGKTTDLVEKVIQFRLLGLHLERISDIALSPVEKGSDRPLAYAQPIRGELELRNVSFRYSETDRFVLENVNLKVEAGKFVTIMGPSGGGKTTLLKIMLGLLEPTSGEVLIDGIPLQTIGVRVYREQVAAVMQEDTLLSGSVADNICFFDADFDHDRMIMCARMAGVHDEIMAMPMAYNSLIGDMGNSLSGGQKQRVLLARALYKNPRILFLDEGTSHLDVEKERQINMRLQHLSVTRISVAHRPDMMSGADLVLRIGQQHEMQEELA